MNPKRINPWSRENDLQLLELRAQGVKFVDIAQITGRTLAAVQMREQLIKKVGIDEETDLESGALRVPSNDPLLARLRQFHGKDKIERDMLRLMEASLG